MEKGEQTGNPSPLQQVNLAQRAKAYAQEIHERIDQRRKYSNQPYSVHLERVAHIVRTVTDDPEMIAAAWLHDVVEDTPATLYDVRLEFGPAVAQLVHELTDVSKPDDGNRAARKAIDRAHLAQASARAQTIKLADLIDNCIDISGNDPRFARVYLEEMDALLAVLTKADETLMRRARRTLDKARATLAKSPEDKTPATSVEAHSALDPDAQFKRQYNAIFRARDIASPLLSFEADTPAERACRSLDRRQRALAALLNDGEVTGYLARALMSDAGTCADYRQEFVPEQIIAGDSGFAVVIHVLTRYRFCFLNILGQVEAVIARDDVNHPYMRMWLFGLITITDMRLTELLKSHFQGDEWRDLLPVGRLKQALELQQHRGKLNRNAELLDCLQLADKGKLIIDQPELLDRFGFQSKNAAKRVVQQFQSLRNHLAHSQDITSHDWSQIARMARRMLG